MPEATFQSKPDTAQAPALPTVRSALAPTLDGKAFNSGFVMPPDMPIWKPELDQEQDIVLKLASIGTTAVEAARMLEATEKDIKSTSNDIKTKWDVRNMAAAVNYGILNRYITFDPDETPISVTPLATGLLRSFALGHHNGDVVRALGRSNEARVAKWSQRIFQEIGANGRTHSVLRSYQTGIFKSRPV